MDRVLIPIPHAPAGHLVENVNLTLNICSSLVKSPAMHARIAFL